MDGDYEDAMDDRAELFAAVAALVTSVGNDKAIQLFEQLKEATRTARTVQPEQRALEAYRKLSRITKEVDAQAVLVLGAQKQFDEAEEKLGNMLEEQDQARSEHAAAAAAVAQHSQSREDSQGPALVQLPELTQEEREELSEAEKQEWDQVEKQARDQAKAAMEAQKALHAAREVLRARAAHLAQKAQAKRRRVVQEDTSKSKGGVQEPQVNMQESQDNMEAKQEYTSVEGIKAKAQAANKQAKEAPAMRIGKAVSA